MVAPIPTEYSIEEYYFGNANIHSLNENVTLTYDMWLEESLEGGETEEIKDAEPEKHYGTWNDDRYGFTVDSDYYYVDMQKFIYLDNVEYGFGRGQYISGEQEYVVLIRPNSKMEIIDTSDWRYETGNSGSDTSESEKKSDNGQQSAGSSKLSNDEIVEKARKKSGAPLAKLDSTDPDGTLNIHLYEETGGHTATWDWYYIDPNTLKGTNLMGEAVDLN